MINLRNIVQYLDTILPPREFEDASLNGLQIESSNASVKKVGIAVDAGLSVIESAINNKCDILMVHHGLFWGQEQAVTGIFGKKVDLLLAGGCSLYASHLPLDAHINLGNNAQLAKYFKLTKIKPFGLYRGKPIGISATYPGKGAPLSYFTNKASLMLGAANQLILPFGPKLIKRVGIISGSGSNALYEASRANLDLFITGEAKQHAYHDAKELKLNVLFAGHYATETFGVIAVAKQLMKKFHIATQFIHEPTGI